MRNNRYPIAGIFLLVCVVMLSACATPQSDPTNPVRKVVILPFSNFSNNIDAPDRIRTVLAKKFESKFYHVVPIEKVDQKLQDEFGITLGEHIEELELRQIAEIIEADAYVFGDVSYYDSRITGIINTNRVSAKIRMVRTGSERVFWSSNVGVKSETRNASNLAALASLGSAISDVSDEDIDWHIIALRKRNDESLLGHLVAGLLESGIKKMIGIDLSYETHAFAAYATRTLPNGPGL